MTTDLTTTTPNAATIHLDRGQAELIRRQRAPLLDDLQWNAYLLMSARTGLDITTNPPQLYAVPRSRRERVNGQWVDKVTEVVYQTGIDGYRAIAHRSGQYTGSAEPMWCGADGMWHDVWVADEPPVAAKVTVFKDGEPFTHTAMYKEYVQKVGVYEGQGENRRKVGDKPNSMWESMPANQLAKCAEAGALRKAFPQQLGGVFVDAEEAGIDYVVEVEQQRIDNERPPLAQPQRRSQQKPKEGSNIPPGRTRDPGPPFGTEDDAAIDAEFHVSEGPEQQGPADQPAATAETPWGDFWNEIQARLLPLADIAAALEIPANVKSFREWYEGNGSSMELADLVADKVAASKGE